MNTRAIQTPNLVYSDDTGSISLVKNIDDRLYLVADFYKKLSFSVIKHYKKVIETLDKNLLNHGVSEYYIYVDSPERFRFGKFLGFEFNNEYLEGHRELEVMKKVL